ncbi:MAG: MBL fold metallo-hydrolase [Actinomycetes bacterium]
MRLTVVGCSGSMPGPRSAASCYLVEHDGFALVLDLGSGALGALQKYIRPQDVGAVLLSHLHADHCMDLCGMYVALRYTPAAEPGGRVRADRLPVHGPPGTGERIAAAYGVGSADLGGVLAFHDVLPGTFALGPFEVTAAPALHPVQCHALRLSAGGRSLVYTGDTAPCAPVAALAAGADVLLAEASFTVAAHNPPDLHLTARQAGELAARAGVGSLVVTHVPPWYEPAAALVEAATAYHGPAVAAEPGMVVEV